MVIVLETDFDGTGGVFVKVFADEFGGLTEGRTVGVLCGSYRQSCHLRAQTSWTIYPTDQF